MGFVHLALALDLCSNDKRYLIFYFRATIEEPALCGFFLLFYWNEKVRTAFFSHSNLCRVINHYFIPEVTIVFNKSLVNGMILVHLLPVFIIKKQ